MIKNKYKKLILSLLFDALGMVTFVIPILCEFGDVIWAPVAAWLMTRMYKGSIGKAAGIFTFIEEILPGFDIIPTFTLMWLYTYLYKKEDENKDKEIEM